MTTTAPATKAPGTYHYRLPSGGSAEVLQLGHYGAVSTHRRYGGFSTARFYNMGDGRTHVETFVGKNFEPVFEALTFHSPDTEVTFDLDPADRDHRPFLTAATV